MKNRIHHSVVVLLPLWLLTPLPADARVQPAKMELVDATGKLIGSVLEITDENGRPKVPLLIDGHATVFIFDTGRFGVSGRTTPVDRVYFTSADCTGQGLAEPDPQNVFFELQAIAGINLTFYAGPNVAPDPREINSMLIAYPSGLEPVCTPFESPEELFVVPVDPVRDLAPLWRPPFRLRAR